MSETILDLVEAGVTRIVMQPTAQSPLAPAPALPRVQPVVRCRVCQTPTEPENLTHLRIYVAGNEGVDVCLTCRQTLTDVLRGMMRANIAGSKRGYFAGYAAGSSS